MSAPSSPSGGDGPVNIEDIIPDYKPEPKTKKTVFGNVSRLYLDTCTTHVSLIVLILIEYRD